MSEIVGHVDGRNRPLLSILVPGRDDALLALIDTGFNGQLFMHAGLAQQLGFALTEVAVWVEFAGHPRRELYVADGRIMWFEQAVDVDVLISTEDRPRAAAPDEPHVLVGTALLNPDKLLIDFVTRRVLITRDE